MCCVVLLACCVYICFGVDISHVYCSCVHVVFEVLHMCAFKLCSLCDVIHQDWCGCRLSC